MQTSLCKYRAPRHSQSSPFSVDAYLTDLTMQFKPLPKCPDDPRYQSLFQIPRKSSIESLAESIIEHYIPSSSFCNDHEMSQYISKSFEDDDFEDNLSGPHETTAPQSTCFYLPSDTDSVASSMIKHGEEALGAQVHDPETRPSTILLPELPLSYQSRQSRITYCAPLNTSSASTSTRSIIPRPGTSPSKRSATPSQLEYLSEELAYFDIVHLNPAIPGSPPYLRTAPPSAPTSLLAPSLSQASTLTNSPPSKRSFRLVHQSRSHRHDHDMEQHNVARSRQPLPQTLVTDQSTKNICHPTISQPLPSLKLPIHPPSSSSDIEPEGPLQHAFPSQSKIDWSDDEDSSARRTIKALKKAVSHSNLRAAGRARSDSANARKIPPMPLPSPIIGQKQSHEGCFGELLKVPPPMARNSNGFSTMTARLIRGSANEAAEVRTESPKTLTKKLSMKKIRRQTGREVEEVPTVLTEGKKRTSAAIMTASSKHKKSAKRVSVRRFRALLRKLRC